MDCKLQIIIYKGEETEIKRSELHKCKLVDCLELIQLKGNMGDHGQFFLYNLEKEIVDASSTWS